MTTKKPIIRINTGDGQFIDREMNEEEFTQHKIDVANSKAKKAEAEAKATAKAALLQRLGITEDEANLLLS